MKRTLKRLIIVVVILTCVPMAISLFSPKSRILCQTRDVDQDSWRLRDTVYFWWIPVRRSSRETFVSERASADGQSNSRWKELAVFTLGKDVRYKPQRLNPVESAILRFRGFIDEHHIPEEDVQVLCEQAVEISRSQGLYEGCDFLTGLEHKREKHILLSAFEEAIADAGIEKIIRSQSGQQATKLGADQPNPIEQILASFRDALKEDGVDLDHLAGMRAVCVNGSYCGSKAVDILNTDPNVLLIIARDFRSHASVYSLGPVLVKEGAWISRRLVCADAVLFEQGTARCGLIVGSPVLIRRVTMKQPGKRWDVLTPSLWYEGKSYGEIAAQLRKPWWEKE